MKAVDAVRCRFADYADVADAAAVTDLLDAYARDPWGGGNPLSPDVRTRLVPALAAHAGAASLLAYAAAEPCGLANCFPGFSTFAAAPLLNIHDFFVVPAARGSGCAAAMMRHLTEEAIRRGCCKLTLEVLSTNTRAQAFYRCAGFTRYGLTARGDGAEFWQRPL